MLLLVKKSLPDFGPVLERYSSESNDEAGTAGHEHVHLFR
jgi:hypothetical protein